jgi:hypothetical protein
MFLFLLLEIKRLIHPGTAVDKLNFHLPLHFRKDGSDKFLLTHGLKA